MYLRRIYIVYTYIHNVKYILCISITFKVWAYILTLFPIILTKNKIKKNDEKNYTTEKNEHGKEIETILQRIFNIFSSFFSYTMYSTTKLSIYIAYSSQASL